MVDDGIDGIFDAELLVMVLILQNQSFREDPAIMVGDGVDFATSSFLVLRRDFLLCRLPLDKNFIVRVPGTLVPGTSIDRQYYVAHFLDRIENCNCWTIYCYC